MANQINYLLVGHLRVRIECKKEVLPGPRLFCREKTQSTIKSEAEICKIKLNRTLEKCHMKSSPSNMVLV